MLKEPIVVGKAYVNARLRVLREVVEEVDEQHVKFHAFDLESGRLLPSRHRVCETTQMAAWAERAASPREMELIHPYEWAAWTDEPGPHAERGIGLEAAKTSMESTPGPHVFPPAK